MTGFTVSYKHLVLVSICWILYEISELWHPVLNEDGDGEARETSVWCRGFNASDRMCIFRNLYYRADTGDFVFVHGPQSSGRVEEELQLSSVAEHGAFYLTCIDLPLSALSHFHITPVHSTTLIMSRFNPDNIMHAIHDDLVPLFSTIRELCTCEVYTEIRSYLSKLTVFFC